MWLAGCRLRLWPQRLTSLPPGAVHCIAINIIIIIIINQRWVSNHVLSKLHVLTYWLFLSVSAPVQCLVFLMLWQWQYWLCSSSHQWFRIGLQSSCQSYDHWWSIPPVISGIGIAFLYLPHFHPMLSVVVYTTLQYSITRFVTSLHKLQNI